MRARRHALFVAVFCSCGISCGGLACRIAIEFRRVMRLKCCQAKQNVTILTIPHTYIMPPDRSELDQAEKMHRAWDIKLPRDAAIKV